MEICELCRNNHCEVFDFSAAGMRNTQCLDCGATWSNKLGWGQLTINDVNKLRGFRGLAQLKRLARQRRGG